MDYHLWDTPRQAWWKRLVGCHHKDLNRALWAFVVGISCGIILFGYQSFPSWFVGRSSIHGMGVFASRDIKKGEKIYPVLRPSKAGYESTTPEFGAYLNHCTKHANAALVGLDTTVYGKDPVWLGATRDIPQGREITMDYTTPAARIWYPVPPKDRIRC